MRFCIITHVPHFFDGKNYWAYRPYVTEMNIWTQYVDSVVIVAPIKNNTDSTIDQQYDHQKIKFINIPEISLISFFEILKALFFLPLIAIKIMYAFLISNHLHLRCPGNIGLIGCIIQMFFPFKRKTAKYAGNWDPKAKQPWSYNLQKRILSSTFFTKNMQVLVYGKWQNQSKNIIPFFTATYSKSDIKSVEKASFNDGVKVMFVGTLSEGKQPIYALKLIENLKNIGYNIHIDFYGEGVERESLENYISKKGLHNFASLHGNVSKETLKKAYKQYHFLILPSKSEGWPKAVAEAMFFGCLPIATSVSCVPFMLDNGNRGILLSNDFDKNVAQIKNEIDNFETYSQKCKIAQNWSQEFTLEKFDEEIKKLLL